MQAKDGFHDDGIFAYGIALILRNRTIGNERQQEVEERQKNSWLRRMDLKQKALEGGPKASLSHISSRLPVKRVAISGVRERRDGRRSAI